MTEITDFSKIKLDFLHIADTNFNPTDEIVFETDGPLKSFTEPGFKCKAEILLVNPTKYEIFMRQKGPIDLNVTNSLAHLLYLKPKSFIKFEFELGQQESLTQMRETPHFLCIQVLSGDQLEYLERDYPSAEKKELYYDEIYFMNTTWGELDEKKYSYMLCPESVFKGNDGHITFSVEEDDQSQQLVKTTENRRAHSDKVFRVDCEKVFKKRNLSSDDKHLVDIKQVRLNLDEIRKERNLKIPTLNHQNEHLKESNQLNEPENRTPNQNTKPENVRGAQDETISIRSQAVSKGTGSSKKLGSKLSTEDSNGTNSHNIESLNTTVNNLVNVFKQLQQRYEEISKNDTSTSLHERIVEGLPKIDQTQFLKNLKKLTQMQNLSRPISTEPRTAAKKEKNWDMVLFFLIFSIIAGVVIKDTIKYNHQLKKNSNRSSLAKMFEGCWPFNRLFKCKNENNIEPETNLLDFVDQINKALTT